MRAVEENEATHPCGRLSVMINRYEVMLLPVLAKSMSKEVSSPTMASSVVPLWPSAPRTGGMLMSSDWVTEAAMTPEPMWVLPSVGVAVTRTESVPETG